MMSKQAKLENAVTNKVGDREIKGFLGKLMPKSISRDALRSVSWHLHLYIPTMPSDFHWFLKLHVDRCRDRSFEQGQECCYSLVCYGMKGEEAL